MTSCGPNTQSYNFTHMFTFNDIRGNLPVKTYHKNSLMFLLDTHPNFTIFTYIVKLADMDIILDNIQANFTLFAPSDSDLKHIDKNVFLNMDTGSARNIVLSSLINNRIPSELLKNSPAMYLNTNSPQNRMFITNIDGITRINNQMRVIHFDIICNNGIIHVVDNLLKPIEL
jgi:hypothetical protein